MPRPVAAILHNEGRNVSAYIAEYWGDEKMQSPVTPDGITTLPI
jgi:hypothetical protein